MEISSLVELALSSFSCTIFCSKLQFRNFNLQSYKLGLYKIYINQMTLFMIRLFFLIKEEKIRKRGSIIVESQ